MPTTSNFGWTTPADTDLVKDGAAAIRTLGNGIDTSLVDLKGGTTGQVLAKASNTDLDFTWSSVDPLTILDAKGDLISATAADTPARLAVGTNGQVLAANSSTATGLEWQTISSGGMTLLSTTSLTSSSTTVSSISGNYTDLQIVIVNASVDSDSIIQARLNSDSGTNYQFSNGNQNAIKLSQSNSVDQTGTASNNWVINLPRYSSTTHHKPLRVTGGYVNSATGGQVTYADGGAWRSNSAINEFTVSTGGASFDSGTIYIYGVK